MKGFLAIALLLLALPAFAQTAPAAPPELPGYNISISGGYSSTSGNATNNGFWSSIAVPIKTIDQAWSFSIAARADYFSISSPSTYVITAGPEARFQFSQANLLQGAVFQPFGNFGLGAARSSCVAANTCPAGADTTSHFAFKLGGGLDMPVNSTMSIRLVELDYIRSTIFPTGHVTISNLAQVSTGLKFTF